MENETRSSIPLTGWQRTGIGGLGFLLITLPVLAYIDQRALLLRETSADLSGFQIVYAILAGIGGIFILSAAVGHWVMWKDVSLLDPGKPDLENVESVKAAPGSSTQSVSDIKPPFDGKFIKVPLEEADPDFVKAARDVFYSYASESESFTAAVQAVFRSTPGRPSWYFLLDTGDGDPSWLKVPHAGRRGAGAGVPRA